MKRRSVSNRIAQGPWACATIVCLVAVSQQVQGQTPWESAPALPAQIPGKAKPPHVVSLPPPPTATNQSRPRGATQTSAVAPKQGISIPAHVPLIAQAGKTDSTGGSLIPDSLSFPKIKTPSQQPPAQKAPSGPLPGLPSGNGGTGAAAFSNLPLPPLPPTGAVPAGNGSKPAGTLGAPGSSSNGLAAAPQSGNIQVAAQPNRSVPGSLVAYEANRNAPSQDVDAVAEEFDAGKLVAVVGADHVLAGDMAGFVEPIIEKNKDRIPSKSEENRLRLQLTRQVLTQYIEIKALYQEFFRDMAGTATPEEIDEMRQTIVTKAGKIFFEKQVPNLMEQHKVDDLTQLEEKLREKAMSLATMRSQFIEQVLGQELERKYVPYEYEFNRDELLDYYREKEDTWQVPAKARWRQITVRFNKHDGDRAEVEALIKLLGNEVYLGGKPFEAVARQSSEGFTAEEGGVYDWTTKGSLKSTQLDQALFSLPLNKLSRVITDDIGMHIIEVLEREEGHKRDFADVQPEIRETLSEKKYNEEREKFRAKVLSRTPIWTLWPEDVKGKVSHVRPLSEALGEAN